MATKSAPQANGVPRKPAARAPAKKPAARAPPKAGTNRAAPVTNKAASVAGGNAEGGGSAYSIMATRIANRVAEMAESITFVERTPPGKQQQQLQEQTAEEKKKAPRKLEMRLQNGSKDSVAFSAPFLDNTLQKMLKLQNRMLDTTAELSNTEGVEEKVIKEHASQSAELSRIIALICAEKARQGA
ncbi:hypothetical protein MBLNU230_g0890t1 [Neophaeotheca triangularis]